MAQEPSTPPASGGLSSEELIRCFSVLSHDLRSPIFTIDGFSDLLIEDYGPRIDEEGLDFLHRIRAAAQNMKRILDDMSQMLKLLSKPTTRVTLDLREIVQELRLKYSALIDESGVSLEVPDTFPVVEGDYDKTREALGALLSNALWFHDKESTGRKVSMEVSEEASMVRCCVTDNGIGIDPRYVQQIFDLGLKLDKSRGGGPGFGLYLARNAMESQGGSLTVSSQPGEGSSFCLLLPKSA